MRLALRHTAWALTAFAFGCVATSCQEPTQITVEVTTDVHCEDAPLTAITVGSLDDVERRPATASSSGCDASGNVGTLVVIPSGAKDAEIAIRVVMGIGQSPDACVADGYTGGCIVARRALRYLPHTGLRVRVPMSVVCRDIPCGVTSTCSRGACAPANVDPGSCATPAGCDPPSPGLVASMSTSRVPYAAALPDGRVLTFSGNTGELYGPTLDTWAPTPNLTHTHQSGGLAQLHDGRVLIVGGSGGSGADLFDPATNTWDGSLSLTQARIYPHMIRLAKSAAGDDRFLVTGGMPSDGMPCTSSAEILDVPARKATPVASMVDARCGHAMTLLADGRVLAFGGWQTTAMTLQNNAEIYDPASDKWTAVASLPASIFSDFAFGELPSALLSDGTVLVLGVDSHMAVYDPAGDAWRELATSGVGSGRGLLTGVDATHFVGVFAPGGSSARSNVAVFDATTLAWTPLMPLAVGRIEPGVVTLAGRRMVFVVGGRDASNGPPLSSAEIVVVP